MAATAACCLSLGAAVPYSLAAGDDLKDRQRKVKQQIRHADDDLEHSSDRLRRAAGQLETAQAQLDAARDRLADVRARLDAARLRDAEMERRLEAAVQRLDDARTDLVEGQAAVEAQRLQVTETITDIYEQGDPELLAFASILNADTPADLTHRMKAQDVIVGRETRSYDDLHAAEVLLEVREDEVEAARDEVADQRQEAAEHLELVKALHVEAQEAEASVRETVRERERARRAAAQARRHDLAVLRELKAREDHIRERILRQSRRAHGGYRGATGGLLMRPVDGPVTSAFGYREHPIYHYWGLHDGADFGADCGAPLYAVAGGVVISRYFSPVYGHRLYLSLGQVNGRNITAVYNHAPGYRVSTGERVARGEVIGSVGSTGWSTGCHLHFTVLADGRPVNPTPYF